MPKSLPWCTYAYCREKRLRPALAGPIVAVMGTLALIKPFLESTGFKLDSALAMPLSFTFSSSIYLGVWVAALFAGCIRQHENEAWCTIDSFGIPGAIAGILELRGMH
jgi:hypothetical protein